MADAEKKIPFDKWVTGKKRKWPKITYPKTPDEMRSHLARIESGEHRTTLAVGLADRLILMFDQLDDKDITGIAAAFLTIAEDEQNSPRTRLRAIRATLKPIQDALKLIPDLQRAQQPKLVDKLKWFLQVFFTELDAGKFRRIGLALKDSLAAAQRGRDRYKKIVLLEDGMATINAGLAILAKFRSLTAATRVEPAADPGRMERAKKRLKEIEAKVIDAE